MLLSWCKRRELSSHLFAFFVLAGVVRNVQQHLHTILGKRFVRMNKLIARAERLIKHMMSSPRRFLLLCPPPVEILLHVETYGVADALAQKNQEERRNKFSV